MKQNTWSLLIALIIYSITLESCKNNQEGHQLFGTWKLEGIKNTLPDPVIEIISFRRPDSLYLATIINDTPYNQMFGKFSLSSDNRLLTTYYSDTSFKLEISRLTDEILELKQVGQSIIQKYSRVK